MKEVYLKISQIVIPDNFKACYPKQSTLARKRMEYKRTKILHPITVLEDGNVMINGYSTYLIAKENKIKKLLCHLLTPDEADDIIEQASEESNIWKKRRRDLFNSHPRCYICGRETHFSSEKETKHDPLAFTLDHIMPLTRGGLTEDSNLITCCKTCNNLKGELTLTQGVQDIIINELIYRGEIEEGYVAPNIDEYIKISQSVPYYERMRGEKKHERQNIRESYGESSGGDDTESVF